MAPPATEQELAGDQVVEVGEPCLSLDVVLDYICDRVARGSKDAAVTDTPLVFGSAAESYERYRSGYPADLIDAVLAYAQRPVRTAVEVGAGTGKATRLFAARGVHVTALEPDPAMARG